MTSPNVIEHPPLIQAAVEYLNASFRIRHSEAQVRELEELKNTVSIRLEDADDRGNVHKRERNFLSRKLGRWQRGKAALVVAGFALAMLAGPVSLPLVGIVAIGVAGGGWAAAEVKINRIQNVARDLRSEERKRISFRSKDQSLLAHLEQMLKASQKNSSSNVGLETARLNFWKEWESLGENAPAKEFFDKFVADAPRYKDLTHEVAMQVYKAYAVNGFDKSTGLGPVNSGLTD